jgi:hypothetical protein
MAFTRRLAMRRTEQGTRGRDYEVDRHEQQGGDAERRQDRGKAQDGQTVLLGEPQRFRNSAGLP